MADEGNGMLKARPMDQEEKRGNKKQRKGIFSRVWNGVFGGGKEGYEKRLSYLAEEEGAVSARMHRRNETWQESSRNIIISTVVLELAAVLYAIMTARSLDLDWQVRVIRFLPMFILPCFSYVIHSATASITRMRNSNDHRTLQNLRAERQAIIDELKEKTNYYTTQQLIQKYDDDPTAKAAAATVLASKLGADSGMKLFVEDESKLRNQLEKSDEMEPLVGLRHRKHAYKSHQKIENDTHSQSFGDETHDNFSHTPEVRGEYHRTSYTYDGGWIARVAAMLVGEDPTQCYALICVSCHMHNGLARKEDFPYITYYCPHCHALNGSQHLQEHEPGSESVSGNANPPGIGLCPTACQISGTESITAGDFSSNLAADEQFIHEENDEKEVEKRHAD